MIKSVFSNGLEDTYKGTRAVKAAWMITETETGVVVGAGHSLDRVKAQKTASTNLPCPHFSFKGKSGAWMRQDMAKQWKCTPRQALARMEQENAEAKSRYTIEVVDVVEM